MAVNLIVLAVTLLMAAFVGVWISFPRLRTWMESPKYRFLQQNRRFLGVLRDGQPSGEDSSFQQGRRPEASTNT